MTRVERLRSSLEAPLLVTSLVNVRYLSGFVSTNAALLVEPDGAAPGLYTDFRYAEAARAVEGVEFVETRGALLKFLAEELSGRIAVEADHIAWSGCRTLEEGGLELVATTGLVEALRAVKDDAELAAIRRACAIADRVYERLASERFVGRAERDVAWTLQQLFHEEGADGPAFDAIVASGPNGARPHARAGTRVVEAGETVVVDAGCTIDGYASDYTRTFFTGPPEGRLHHAYEVCRRAQEAGLSAIRAGVAGVDVDGVARSVIDAGEFAGSFGHGLGHGLGLVVHEAPRLGKESTDTLAPGNVVTVEPGIYLPGLGGIRIEDNVVVTADGLENLTAVTKEPVEVS
jgi:Xaa-Pro aminopeptidase